MRIFCMICNPLLLFLLLPPPPRDPNGNWILARVVRYLPDRESYEVRDEDDSKIMTIAGDMVIRLEDSIGDIQKNEVVGRREEEEGVVEEVEGGGGGGVGGWWDYSSFSLYYSCI